MAFGFNQKYSASGYKAQLDKAWKDQALSLDYFIHYSISNHQLIAQIEEKLITNQREIGGFIGHFYGVKTSLSEELVKFMNYTSQAIEVLKWKKGIKHFRKQWYEGADGLIQALNSLAKWELRNLFYSQIACTEALIQSYLKEDLIARKNYFNRMVELNSSISEVLADTIITEKKELFGQ